MKSEVKFTIGEKERGFKFGTYTARLIEEKSGFKLSEFLSKMSGKTEEVEKEDGTKETVVIEHPDLDCQGKFYFCCALHFHKSHTKTEPDFDEVDVDDWRDELGIERMSEITVDLFNQYSLKN